VKTKEFAGPKVRVSSKLRHRRLLYAALKWHRESVARPAPRDHPAVAMAGGKVMEFAAHADHAAESGIRVFRPDHDGRRVAEILPTIDARKKKTSAELMKELATQRKLGGGHCDTAEISPAG